MSKDLKPCPFCGSTNISACYDPHDPRDFIVVCNSCLAQSSAAFSARKAINKWNKRVERTCHIVTTRRSFSQTQDKISKKCSECGHVFGETEIRPLLPGFGDMIEIGSVDIPNYCPNCGAKVVDE